MNENVYEKYLRAGKIAAEARDIGIKLIKPGIKFLEVAEEIESKILESGASLSFPVNIAINELAAHYSPRNDEEYVFKRGDVVKLDVGSHIDGYIADTAITIEIETNKYDRMIRASSDALDFAINLMRANIDLSEIGNVIEKTIKSYGYNSIDNLTGHSLDRYELHSGISVPSVSNTNCRIRPKPGDVLAIEPFATNGSGHVISGKGSNIYIIKPTIKSKIIRDNKLKSLFKHMKTKFKTLPFAQRWCNNMSDNIDISLKKLAYLGIIKNYPQLIEQNEGIVTQKEHTVIVKEDGCEVIT
jgi:methionyl aminopeptidase